MSGLLSRLLGSLFARREVPAAPPAPPPAPPASPPAPIPVSGIGEAAPAASTDSIPQATVLLLEQFEGCRLRPYLCPSGIPTIGIGTTHYPGGRKVRLTDPEITREEAERFCRSDLAQAGADVRRLVKVPLLPHERAALVMFMHNCGGGEEVAGSTLLGLLHAGKKADAAEQFDRWINGTDPKTGKKGPLKGLRRRRRAEKLLFLGGPPEWAVAQALRDFP